jgi:hypothetical protein
MTHVPSAFSYIISDLDHFDSNIIEQHKDAPASVLIMQMRSKRSPDRNHFLAVDTSLSASFVPFLFEKDRPNLYEP